MPDIQMCPDDECPYIAECIRHPNSGTRPAAWQAWGFFEKTGPSTDPLNCEGWTPKREWTKEVAEGAK